jgi:hypothetical protein
MEGTMLDTATGADGHTAADGDRAEAPDRSRRGARPLWRVAAVIGLLAFVVRVWAPGPVTQTTDEFAWWFCSDAFHSGVVDGNLGDASTSACAGPRMTQPGVTTMWAGTIGRGVLAAGESLGALPDEPGTPADRARILRAGRWVVSLWCAIALVALIVIAAKLVGRRAAVVAGVLLAAEPFLVGHSHVLHTDAMVTMFGALAVVALAAACRDRSSPVDRKLLVLAGVAAGLTILTKLNGVPLVLGGAAVVLLVQTDWSRAARAMSLRRSVIVGLAFLGVAVATFYIAFPALWVNPWSELQRLPRTLDEMSVRNRTYFRYAVREDPGPLFYPFALVLRLSPWLLLAAAASVVASVVHLLRRPRAGRDAGGSRSWPAPAALTLLLLAPVPYAVLISFTEQKYDRYALPVVPYLALLAGIGIVVAADRWSERFGDRALVPAGLAAAVAMLAVAVALQPYAISFANPLTGGQKRARNIIMLGWGEGYEVLGAEIERREAGNCDDVGIHTSYIYATFIALPCGDLVRGEDVGSGDYVIRYIADIQRNQENPIQLDVMRRGELVKEVNIHGVTYAELWQYPD